MQIFERNINYKNVILLVQVNYIELVGKRVELVQKNLTHTNDYTHTHTHTALPAGFPFSLSVS